MHGINDAVYNNDFMPYSISQLVMCHAKYLSRKTLKTAKFMAEQCCTPPYFK